MRVLCLLICLASSAWAEFLRLEDVLRETDRHHPKLRAAALVREVAAAKTLEKQGAIDPSLMLGTEWLRYQSGSEPGKPKSAADNQLFYQVQDPYGWKLSAGYRLNRGAVKSPDSGTGAGGEYFLEFKLPLLRGAGINPKQTAVEVAREGELLAAAYQRAARLEVLLATALAYWDWVVAVQVRALVDANLRLAQDRLGQVQGRVKAGDLAPIEAVEAEQEVQRRQEALAKSQRDLEKAELKLGFYLWRSDGQPGGLPGPERAPPLLEGDPARAGAELLAQAELHSLKGGCQQLSLAGHSQRRLLGIGAGSPQQRQLELKEILPARPRAGVGRLDCAAVKAVAGAELPTVRILNLVEELIVHGGLGLAWLGAALIAQPLCAHDQARVEGPLLLQGLGRRDFADEGRRSELGMMPIRLA